MFIEYKTNNQNLMIISSLFNKFAQQLFNDNMQQEVFFKTATHQNKMIQ